jgi:FkbM family methyltransferase
MHPALRSIAYGNRLRDKAVVSLHLATVALFPLGVAGRKVGRPLPDPRRWLGEYVVTGPGGIFACPPFPSPFFLGADPDYEPAICSSIIGGVEGGVFVDVGASIGFITVRAAKRARRVIAVEPHPVRFAYLERNVELNGLTNVTCLNCALGSEESMITLYDIDPTLGPHPLDASTRPGRGHRYEVPLHRLDNLVDEPVSFVKIDVEGDELNVLRGASRLFESGPVTVIESLNGEHLSQIRELLPHYSFREFDRNNFLGRPSDVDTGGLGSAAVESNNDLR